MDTLARQSCCRSAQEIHAELQRGDRRVGLASVYRTLDTLAELGLVHRLDVDGIAAYEPALPDGEHHHHVICSTCGRVDTFEDDDLERAIARGCPSVWATRSASTTSCCAARARAPTGRASRTSARPR